MVQQIIINGLISAAIYSLVGMGFSIIYRTAHFFHIAHGVVLMVGPYSVLFLHHTLRVPLPCAIPIGVCSAGALGALIEVAVYKPLRHKSASSLIFLLASLGTYVVLQNLISLAFGDGTKSINRETVRQGISFLGARITSIQILTIFAAMTSMMLMMSLLRSSRAGTAIRAVASNSELAGVSGIATDKIILCSFTLGSVLAGLAGILLAMDVNMNPTMGMGALMMGVVAVIVGGVDSVAGIGAAALLLGLTQHSGGWLIGSQWQDAIAFVVLVGFLLAKPQGFFGKNIRTAVI